MFVFPILIVLYKFNKNSVIAEPMTCSKESICLLSYRKMKIFYVYCLCWCSTKRKSFTESYTIPHFIYKGTSVVVPGGKYLWCGWSKAAHSGMDLLNTRNDCAGVTFGCCSCIYAPEALLLRQDYSSHNDSVTAVRKYSPLFITV